MRPTLTLAVLLAGSALSAQTPTFSLATGLSLPLGDLKDRADFGTNQFFGTHLGGQVTFAINSRHAVRAQLTYQHFPGSSWGGFAASRNDFGALQAGADWVYQLEQPYRGWYTLAGASLNQVKDSWDYVNSAGRRVSGSSSQGGKLGVRGGGGYAFSRRFALEGTLNQIFVDAHGGDGFGFDTATWIQVSAVFHFGR